MSENPTRFVEALSHFKLNWSVETRPLFTFGNDGNHLLVEDAKSIVRTDLGLPLAVVGNRYLPLQNDAAADIVDGVLAKTGGSYTKGGMFGLGRKVYVQALLPDTITVKGRDASQKLLTFITSHDMTTQMLMGFTAIRIVCQNTYMAAMKDIANQIVIRHTKSAESKLETVQAILESQLVYFRELEIKANWLADQRFTDLQMDLAMRKVLNVKEGETDIAKKTLTIMDTIRGNFQNHDGFGGTAWDAYNAFTKYTNHQKATRGAGGETESEKASLAAERRFEGILLGQGAALNDSALSAIEAQLVS